MVGTRRRSPLRSPPEDFEKSLHPARAKRAPIPSILMGPQAMAAPELDLERCRSLLRLQVRLMEFDPRLRRRFDSSDLIQETLLRAHANRAGFRGGTDAELVKWLQEILAHVVRDEVRKAHARKCDVGLEQSLDAALADSSARLGQYLAASQASPILQAERQEQVLRLAAAIDRLPADQQDVVIQRDLQGASVSQIAERMGRSEKAVAGLLSRARSRLRELLEEER
jgi:RNA polymerase sigma-70 factor (ECF subfamily)